MAQSSIEFPPVTSTKMFTVPATGKTREEGHGHQVTTCSLACFGKQEIAVRSRDRAYSCVTMSTETSTAGIVPRFSSQCRVFLSSGQPTPGP